MNAIEITDLRKTFLGKKHAKVNALKGVSFTVRKGEIFGFLGPNGAGKSTTIKILMGLIKPTAGNAKIMGYDTASHLARRHVGYLPENPAFYDYLTAAEYLAFTARIFDMNGAQVKGKIEEVLKLLDLWDARTRPLREYSKGMVQRLGLAHTLIHDPDVFILDEPMSGLDPAGRALVKQIILDLRTRSKCVFFSTHITSDVETVCDRVGVIVDGTLQCVENVGAILTSGIVGYHIRYRTAGVQEREHAELIVAKEDIARTMVELQQAGHEVTLIEPERKNLETFFLDVVKGKKC